MIDAAATIAQTFWFSLVYAARWLATKTLIIFLLMVVLPWVLKGILIWGFEYIVAYGREWGDLFMGLIGSLIGEAASTDVSVSLTGVGGFLAVKTGLIDYASIIFSGWGVYWVVAVLAKTPGVR